MVRHQDLTSHQLHSKIRNGEIQYAGNARLKIYGTLKCSSGKRMKKENRVFFKDVGAVQAAGFRQCRHCLKTSVAKI